jgi:hypothetical protein
MAGQVEISQNIEISETTRAWQAWVVLHVMLSLKPAEDLFFGRERWGQDNAQEIRILHCVQNDNGVRLQPARCFVVLKVKEGRTRNDGLR